MLGTKCSCSFYGYVQRVKEMLLENENNDELKAIVKCRTIARNEQHEVPFKRNL